MKNQTNNTHKTFLTGMEFLILCLIFAGMGIQILLNEDHIAFQILRGIYAPAMVFLAGLYTYEYQKQPIELIKKAGIYTVLYLFFGLCNQVLINHKMPFRSFVRLLTLEKLPTPSEMFFTTAILFFTCAFLVRFVNLICRKKKLFALLSILLAGMAFFPKDIFGYPLIGVFTGCNTYDCIPLLPYTIFLFLGICAAENSAIFLLPFFSSVGSVCVKLTTKLVNLLKKWYQDFFDNKRSALPLYFVVYTFLFCIMACCVFISFFEYDNSIAWMHDAVSQYIPRVHFFSDYVKDCVSHLANGNFNFPSYTFRAGLGNAVPLSYEPVYWLFALFDSSNAELAYNIITVFRFYLAGLSASVFFLYYKRGYFESLIGSMVYTFCGFAIYAGVLHAHFIGPMIFLPLLILATEEIFRKKRWYLCTIFVALALPANYYFIYMSTIAMGIYYVCRFLFTKNPERKNWNYFFTTTLTFAGSYLLGVVIGNISLFTSFSSYVGSGRAGTSEVATTSFFYYGRTWLTKLFTYFISSPGSPGMWLKLGFVPLSYLAVVILFMKKDRKLLKCLFAIALSCCIFPIAAYILGGFSTITNRWCYIFALLVSYITVLVIPELKNLSRRELKILLCAMLPYIIIILMDRDYRTEYTLCSLVILLGTYILILCMNQEIHLIGIHAARASLVFLCCAALTLNAYYQYLGGNNTSKTSFAKTGHVLDESTDTPMKVLADYPDDSFYRVSTAEIPRQNLSSSLISDYNSIAVFSSTISSPIMDYNCEMGNTAWNLVQLGGFDNRTYMNALSCVKYYALTKEEQNRLPYGYEQTEIKEKDDEDIYVYKNKYALPLGYTYDSVIDRNTFEQYNTVEKQEVLLKSALVEESVSDSALKSAAPSLTSEEVAITDCQMNGITFKNGIAKVKKPGATLTLSFEGMKNSETYLVLDGCLNPTRTNGSTVISMDFSCQDYKRSFDFRSSNHTYSTGQDTYLFNLGYRKDAAKSLTITFQNTGSFTVDSLKVYCQPMDCYASDIEKLTKSILENVKIDGNEITGTITNTKNKLLVLSIPYQKGWTAYVDGKETDIQKVNLMYMGIELTPGKHEIRLEFKRPGIQASLCLSGFGVLIFIIALIIRRNRIKMSK